MRPEPAANPPMRRRRDEAQAVRDCPRCERRSLGSAEFEGSAILRCGRCAGHFIPRESAAAVWRSFPMVGSLDPRRLEEVKKAASTRNLHDGVRYLACPICGERMDRRPFAVGSGIVVDRCLRDGVWFDGGELELAVAYFAAGGPREARARPRSGKGSPPLTWASTKEGVPPVAPTSGGVPNGMIDLLLWLLDTK